MGYELPHVIVRKARNKESTMVIDLKRVGSQI
jgi:hypothetical protein